MFSNASLVGATRITIPVIEGFNLYPGQSDGSVHASTRKAVMAAFTPQKVGGLRQGIRDDVQQLVTALQPRGRADFMQDFIYDIPIRLFLTMMGLPLADGPYLVDLQHQVTRSSSEDVKLDCLGKMFAYLEDAVERCYAAPGTDLLSEISLAQHEGERMPKDFVYAIAANLLLGGLDTVAAMTGFAMRYLASDEALRHTLAQQPEKIDAAVDEFMRRFAVVVQGRTILVDGEYEGIQLRKGEQILLPTPMHALSAERYENPGEIQLGRDVGNKVMSFGRGRHACLGRLLGKLEMQEILTGWFSLIPDFRIAADAKPTVSCGHVHTLTSLPLEWS
jgi:cytochrome P450